MLKSSALIVGGRDSSYANLRCEYPPFPNLKIEQKLPKTMNYISNLQFGKNSVKIRLKRNATDV